ncbi:PWWP domain-containing DNA repair factor 3A-like [Megalobrama amblycephala]|uniref:PWWP domain-containing DNA repair factor 3A-like n=1 Tax=Megalobrama amblycephala TaxID=75352 RepID=UPI00201452A2|nr:PWWP domain-containing DNA repair factor 3A-like [Megalobrama amblycephala]
MTCHNMLLPRGTESYPTRLWWTSLWQEELMTTFSPSSVDKKNQQWLDTFSKCSIKKVPVPLFIEDQEQIDIIYTHLTSILNSTPTHTHSDQIRFIMDVLFPESIICALAVVEHVSILEAEGEIPARTCH